MCAQANSSVVGEEKCDDNEEEPQHRKDDAGAGEEVDQTLVARPPAAKRRVALVPMGVDGGVRVTHATRTFGLR